MKTSNKHGFLGTTCGCRRDDGKGTSVSVRINPFAQGTHSMTLHRPSDACFEQAQNTVSMRAHTPGLACPLRCAPKTGGPAHLSPNPSPPSPPPTPSVLLTSPPLTHPARSHFSTSHPPITSKCAKPNSETENANHEQQASEFKTSSSSATLRSNHIVVPWFLRGIYLRLIHCLRVPLTQLYTVTTCQEQIP